jgi:multisubunit Na+/H+ antiporter MnhG subunit
MCLALGFAAASIAQMSVFQVFHQGSPYIVAKHLFGVTTLLAAVAASWMPSGLPSNRWRSPLAATLATIIVCAPIGGHSIIKAILNEDAVRTSSVGLTRDSVPQERFAFRVGILHQPDSEAFAIEHPDE